MLFDGSNVNLLISFLAGFITFFTSCLLPLVPTYLAYITPSLDNKRMVLKNSAFFTLGFLFVFILLGASVSGIGLFLVQYKRLIEVVGGIFLVIIGLFMLGVVNSYFLQKEVRLDFTKYLSSKRKRNSFVFGLVFGFAWTPCIGPVLGVILFWASQVETIFKGMMMLLSFGLGVGMPFIILGMFYEKLHPLISKNQKLRKILNDFSALIIILTGVLLIFDYISQFSLYVLNLLNLDRFSF